jgi:hypothetical protein
MQAPTESAVKTANRSRAPRIERNPGGWLKVTPD